MINGTHHVSLSTPDMDRCLAFYCDLLGLPLISLSVLESTKTPAFARVVGAQKGAQDVKVAIAKIGGGNLRIEVFCYESPRPAAAESRLPWDIGIRHLCFDVTNIDAGYERLKNSGVIFISEPQYFEGTHIKACYFRDPDNNIVEFQEVLPGSTVDRAHVRTP